MVQKKGEFHMRLDLATQQHHQGPSLYYIHSVDTIQRLASLMDTRWLPEAPKAIIFLTLVQGTQGQFQVQSIAIFFLQIIFYYTLLQDIGYNSIAVLSVGESHRLDAGPAPS